MTRIWMVVALFGFTGACVKGDGSDSDSDSGSESESGGASGGSGASDGTDGTGGGTGSAGGTTAGGDGTDKHGHVKIMFRRAESEAESPFVGTQNVEISLSYDNCLTAFYNANPNWESTGVDGAPVFADFADPGHADDLCAQQDPMRPAAACEVLAIEHDLLNQRLKARYTILDADMEDKILFLGPIPCEVLTQCRGLVVAGGGAGTGFGANDAVLWTTSSFPQREAICDQGLPIELKIRK